MKTIKLLPALLIALSLIGCKEKQPDVVTDEVIEETVVKAIPRASDTYFEQAINAYENADKVEAKKKIDAGIEALDKESKDVSGLNKANLDMSKDQLRNIASKLDGNFDISVEGLKEAIANAEINIAHNYLATDDVYVLTPKARLRENYLQNALDYNLKSLEAGTSKLTGEARIEGEKLGAEGKKLKEEFEAWKKRAEDHAKRADEHFKKHQTEYSNYDRVYAM
ncbi:MAG: hypothetical protein ACOH2D_07270 [Gelidibacter sp.]|uniref:hypothetical protein n=1 Tax=Gelidibacter sp. TaxID=2018083 RepID=UPI003267A11C